jgi:hypothetical protein
MAEIKRTEYKKTARLQSLESFIRITSIRSNLTNLKTLIDSDIDYSVDEKKEYNDAVNNEV